MGDLRLTLRTRLVPRPRFRRPSRSSGPPAPPAPRSALREFDPDRRTVVRLEHGRHFQVFGERPVWSGSPEPAPALTPEPCGRQVPGSGTGGRPGHGHSRSRPRRSRPLPVPL